MSLSAHSALASLTANYMDSEPEEDDVEKRRGKDEPEGKPPGDSVLPAGESYSRDAQSVSSRGEYTSGGSRSKSNNPLGLVLYQDDLIDDDVVDDYGQNSDSLQDNAVGKDDSSTVPAEGGNTVGGVKPYLVDLKDISQEMEASDENELPEKPSKKPRIPSEPALQCTAELQEKFTQLMGYNMNAIIQSNKQFRNPSIYEKLIIRCGIDELGTNYPKHIYDPHIWVETSYYDELAKAQKTEMEKCEKERKDRTKVEFVSGPVKKAAPSSGSARSSQPEEKNPTTNLNGIRKMLCQGLPRPLQHPTVPPVLVQPLFMASASGTKGTVINAFGSLPKKPKMWVTQDSGDWHCGRLV